MAVAPTAANKMSRNLEVSGEGFCAAEREAEATDSRVCDGRDLRARRKAMRAAKRLRATAQAMVRRSPSAGSRTNPARSVPEQPPGGVTQYRRLTRTPRSARLRVNPRTTVE